MKRCKQDDTTGCGIACIAMLANKSYEDVKAVAIRRLGFDANGALYTSTGQLRELGMHFGVDINVHRQRKFRGWVHLPNTAILAIKPEPNGNWHWVVFVRRSYSAFVLDPWKTVKSNKRTDFWRMKPIGFLPIGEEAA